MFIVKKSTVYFVIIILFAMNMFNPIFATSLKIQTNSNTDNNSIKNTVQIPQISHIKITGAPCHILETITFRGIVSNINWFNYIEKFQWDFGDGTKTPIIKTNSRLNLNHEVGEIHHTYWNTGRYDIIFNIWDNNGYTDSYRIRIDVINEKYESSNLGGKKDILKNLAKKYAPVLYLDPEAPHNCPIKVDQLLKTSKNGNVELKEKKLDSLDPVILTNPTLDDLRALSGENYYLNQPANNLFSRKHNDFDDSSEEPTVYVHIKKNKEKNLYFIQYYFFYYHNKGTNNHESDLEMIQLSFNQDLTPIKATYSQHIYIARFNYGEKRDWDNVEKYIYEQKFTTHPCVYVSSGKNEKGLLNDHSNANSHANYFYKGDGPHLDYTNSCDHTIGYTDSEAEFDTTYNLEFLPNLEDDISQTVWSELGWIQYAGKWGETHHVTPGFNGVQGPVFLEINLHHKYKRWIHPYPYEIDRNYDGKHTLYIWGDEGFKFTKLDVTDKTVKKGDNVLLEAHLKDNNNQKLKEKKINFYIDNNPVGTAITDKNGYCSIEYTNTNSLTYGNHEIRVVYKGQNEEENDYSWVDKKNTLTITDEITTIFLEKQKTIVKTIRQNILSKT